MAPADQAEIPRLGLIQRGRALLATARLTTTPATFVTRELASRIRHRAGVIGEYRLRRGGGPLVIRHGTDDIPLVFDLLVQGHYAPPGPVREVLAQGGPKRVVDLGGNIGLFSRFITEVVEVSDLTTYEPDPANLALLKRNLAELPGGLTPTIVPVCAGVSDGSVRFETGSFGRSRVLGGDDADGGPKVSVLPCEDVLPRLMDADLIKIDIEGSEWEILADPRFRESPARAIVMEYHSWRCPGGDPRTTAERMFRDMGFNVRTEREHVHGFGELWAWR